MTAHESMPLSGDKMKKAIQKFSELLGDFPEKSRSDVLQMVQLQFDLSPLECDFLNKNFTGKQ